MTVFWEPCAGGVRVLRLLGDTPCPAVPGVIGGLPVVEIGPYCFAEKPVRPGAQRTGTDTHEITGNFVEEVTLPDTVRVLHSAAFYNCRKLRRVTLGAGVESLGSDLFTNCRQLRVFTLRAAADAPTENTPAHIFNHSIEGEGYRMRQCFTPGGAVDYAAFDASFTQACVGESADTLCRLALGRLVQPFGLSDNARADYELYLTAHPADAFKLAIDTRDEAALRLLVGLGLPTADAAVYCSRAGWSAGAAILLGRPRRVKKTYDFEDL